MAETIELAVEEVRTKAFLAMPEGAGPHAGVVVTYHREGLDAFTEWKVDHLAAAGFAAIAPDHYHVLPEGVGFQDRGKYLTDEQMAADIEAAARWLAARHEVAGDRLAVLGPCMGGRTALVALECHPELWTCACVWYGGEVFEPLIGDLPAPGDRARLGLIDCPIAGFFGDLDTHPSPEEVDRLDRLLTELGKDHVFYRYPDAGHGFLNPWHHRYHQAAAEDSWGKALGFLGEKLAAGA
ncbi:MAG: dienelactone hydrolase family protein [Alphaproteobacteria bacterium]|nr:dienelactone hydrolase family protein [Alphaproteobacteria bacterium]